jgi:glycosyltransferase involved in cell wall biosynthesis
MSSLIDPSSVFIIVPAYNEHQVIKPVLDELLSLNYSVVVLDDGSTPPMAESISGLPVYLLRHRVNLGQGAALQTGISFALNKKAAAIVSFDADGQHDPADIEKMIAFLATGETDIVIGSRFITGARHNMPAGRRFLVQVARVINYLFTGLLLTDAHNGLRAFSSNAASMLRIKENRMAHATEILEQIRKKKLRYREIPVNIRYTNYSLSKGQSGWGGFRILFDLLLKKLFR